MRNAFAGFTIAVAGNLGPGKETAAIKRWVETAGGDFAQSVTSDTTHLICDKELLKKANKLVQDAIRHAVHIVSYDWLEDSLAVKGRKREGPYLLTKAKAKTRSKEKAKPKQRAERKAKQRNTAKRLVKEFDAGCRQAKVDLNSGRSTPVPCDQSLSSDSEAVQDTRQKAIPPTTAKAALAQLRAARAARDAARLAEDKNKEAAVARTDLELPAHSADNHHYYRDDTGFVYNVTVSRVDTARNTNERFQLRIYESNAKPHTYALHIRYFDSVGNAVPQLPCPIGSSYSAVFREFRRHFLRNCRIKWEERQRPRKEIEAELERERMAKVEMIEMRSGEVPENLRQKLKPFVYMQPINGMPKGSVVQELEDDLEAGRLFERKETKESQTQEQIAGTQDTGKTDSTMVEDRVQDASQERSHWLMTPEFELACEYGQTHEEFSMVETSTVQEPVTALDGNQTEQDQVMVEGTTMHDSFLMAENPATQEPTAGSESDQTKQDQVMDEGTTVHDEFLMAEIPTAQEPITALEGDQTEQEQTIAEGAMIQENGIAIEDSQLPDCFGLDNGKITAKDLSKLEDTQMLGEVDEGTTMYEDEIAIEDSQLPDGVALDAGESTANDITASKDKQMLGEADDRWLSDN